MIDIDDEINQSHEGKYMNILQQVANRQKTSINIEFDDLKLFLTNYDQIHPTPTKKHVVYCQPC